MNIHVGIRILYTDSKTRKKSMAKATLTDPSYKVDIKKYLDRYLYSTWNYNIVPTMYYSMYLKFYNR